MKVNTRLRYTVIVCSVWLLLREVHSDYASRITFRSKTRIIYAIVKLFVKRANLCVGLYVHFSGILRVFTELQKCLYFFQFLYF
jgi:hypothetical protein